MWTSSVGYLCKKRHHIWRKKHPLARASTWKTTYLTKIKYAGWGSMAPQRLSPKIHPFVKWSLPKVNGFLFVLCCACELPSAHWKEAFCNSWNLEGFGPGVQSLDLVLCMGVMAPSRWSDSWAPAPPKPPLEPVRSIIQIQMQMQIQIQIQIRKQIE